MDNHTSHFDFNTFRIALDNDVHIVGLPSNGSHLYQPLDVGVFKDLKIEWRKILQHFLHMNRLQKVTKNIFPQLLNALWQKLRPSYLISGFRGTGLCPFNPNRIDPRKFLPSIAVTKIPTIRMSQRNSALTVDGPSSSSAPTSSGIPIVSVRVQKPTPKTAMRISIERAILGPQQQSTNASGSKKRSKLQSGLVHTELSAMKALAEREKARQQTTGTSKRRHEEFVPSRAKKIQKSSDVRAAVGTLEESEDEMETKCFICFSERNPPTRSRRINWNRCLNCKRWYHEWCQKKKEQFCPFCPTANV